MSKSNVPVLVLHAHQRHEDVHATTNPLSNETQRDQEQNGITFERHRRDNKEGSESIYSNQQKKPKKMAVLLSKWMYCTPKFFDQCEKSNLSLTRFVSSYHLFTPCSPLVFRIGYNLFENTCLLWSSVVYRFCLMFVLFLPEVPHCRRCRCRFSGLGTIFIHRSVKNFRRGSFRLIFGACWWRQQNSESWMIAVDWQIYCMSSVV